MEKVFNGKFINMFRTANGYEFASRKEKTYRKGNTKPDAVVVVAKHQPSNKLVVIKNFRLAINQTSWELPAGIVDEGETVVEAAKRELWEETGLTLTKTYNIRNTFPTAGLTDEQHCMVFCDCVGELSTENTTDTEEITAHLFDKYELNRIVLSEDTIGSSCFTCMLLIMAMSEGELI